MNLKLLYYAGMASVISYLLADIIGGIITPNYSIIENAVSELIQSGAENRLLLSSFTFVHGLMGILFGIGIILHHPYNEAKLIFIGGILLMIIGLNNALSGSIFPQDPIGGKTTFEGTMHLILVGINVVLVIPTLLMIGQGLYRYKNWESFRSFTFICVPIILISGVLSAYVIANEIKLMGLTERMNVYTFFIWVFTLAYLLIKE